MKVKSFKVYAVVLMIAVFSVAGIISCSGGENITGSSSRSNTVVEDNTGGGTTPEEPTPEEPVIDNGNNGDTGDRWNIEETKGKSFYGSSYRTVYIMGVSPTPWIRVSYNDTDRLDRMWKFMIDRGRRDGNHRLYIKTDDGDFFFDEDYNIRWSKKPAVILKRFQGGVIAQLRQGYGNNVHASAEWGIIGGEAISGKFTIGGLYTFAMHVKEAEKLNSSRVNQFFGRASEANHSSGWNFYGGRMEVLVMHAGYPVDLGTGLFRVNGNAGGKGWSGTAYAAQTYMSKFNNGYEDGNGNGLYNIKGNSPERYMPNLNVTHQLYHLSFRWALDKTYSPNNYQ